MTTFNSSALHVGTPSLVVLCSRGLPVGELACHRAQAAEAVELRITRHWHDARGNLAQSLDPRLAETATPNFRWHNDLAGRPVHTESVDAGSSVGLPDVAGRPLLAVSATGVSQVCIYETPSLPGRLLAVTEQSAGEALPRIAERFRWAGPSPVEKNRNLAGQCVRHYDTAGLIELQALALSGAALAQSRRVLAGEDEADWSGGDEQAWQTTLEPECYVTLRTLDATGIQLTQTDAQGHQQRQAYDVAGQLQGSWLTLQGQAEQVIVAALRYSPSGHKQQEVHGNGVVTDYGLDPLTQRLTGIRVQRPGTLTSTATTLQDLRYRYDPVGNVQSVRNDAEALRFWRNQQVTAASTFAYDSLYQLVEATGREMVRRGAQGPQLPEVRVPLPIGEGALTNYTRRYSYDRAGNLTQMQHSAPASNNTYTTRMTVSNRSNRAVLAREGLLPEQVDALFDAGGHQLELLAGQDLRWNARGELAQVKPVEREAGVDDREWYRYGSDGMRLLKVSEQQAVNLIQAQRVLYLDDLELRDTHETSRLHVIKVAAGDGAEVRVLHWASGLPAGLDNDQVRYSYHNLIGSSGLELDGDGAVVSQEEYYPFGGTSVWTARSQIEAECKTLRYSGKERDATGLYYYGYRYYQPWAGRWLSVDPAGVVEGLNLYRMVRNNPVTRYDFNGLESKGNQFIYAPFVGGDILFQIAGYNLVRERGGKQILPVMVASQAAVAALEKLRGDEVSRSERVMADMNEKIASELRSTGLDLAGLKALHGARFDKYLASLDFVSKRAQVLRRMEIRHDMSNVDPEKDRLFILGHGLPGVDFLAADTAVLNETASAGEVARQFLSGGLPKRFKDVRVNTCFSADTIAPVSFEANILADAAKPVLLKQTDGKVVRKEPFAQSLKSAMASVGYDEVKVTGYHAEGMLYSKDTHHTRVIGGDARRRKLVRVTF